MQCKRNSNQNKWLNLQVTCIHCSKFFQFVHCLFNLHRCFCMLAWICKAAQRINIMNTFCCALRWNLHLEFYAIGTIWTHCIAYCAFSPPGRANSWDVLCKQFSWVNSDTVNNQLTWPVQFSSSWICLRGRGGRLNSSWGSFLIMMEHSFLQE